MLLWSQFYRWENWESQSQVLSPKPPKIIILIINPNRHYRVREPLFNPNPTATILLGAQKDSYADLLVLKPLALRGSWKSWGLSLKSSRSCLALDITILMTDQAKSKMQCAYVNSGQTWHQMADSGQPSESGVLATLPPKDSIGSMNKGASPTCMPTDCRWAHADEGWSPQPAWSPGQ